MPEIREFILAEHAGMAALAKHMSLRAVAGEYQCAPSTVQSLTESTAMDPNSSVDNALLNKKQPGYPQAYSKREERAVVKIIQQHYKLKPKKLVPVVEANVRRLCLSIIHRIMRENGLERFLALSKPLLTALHRRKRLADVKKALRLNP